MTRVEAAAWAVMDARADRVYSVLADYHEGHREILPKQYFSDVEVERGGTGAGTRIQFTMHAMGTTKTYLTEISEPIPGSVLLETNLDQQGASTTFTVVPVGDGSRSMVTIRTEWQAHGLRGVLERIVAPRALRRIYREELNNLAKTVRHHAERRAARAHRLDRTATFRLLNQGSLRRDVTAEERRVDA
jgi:hypothetical protein